MPRILVVEDQADIRDLIRMTLEMGGYDVREAGDGPTALVLADKQAPDLMLLDVMMPGGMTGLDVCRRIRSQSKFRKTRVVMLSARDQPADRRAGKDAGADEYLTKPFSPRELLQVVGRSL